jgi:hypothetical protein
MTLLLAILLEANLLASCDWHEYSCDNDPPLIVESEIEHYGIYGMWFFIDGELVLYDGWGHDDGDEE